MPNSKLGGLLGPMRLPFLVLNPACVALGAATAYYSGYPINLVHLAIVFIGAISAHICVNALNEYDDFKSGLDFKTVRTPFSGGSGTLPENPHMARSAYITGLMSLLIAVSIGVYFLWVVGIGLLPLGLMGIFLLVAYTRWLTKNPVLCLIAPGLGFGPCMVMGTHFVLTGSYSMIALVASIVPFCLVSNLLLLNQFPDIEADKTIGRKHLPIVIGSRTSVYVYAVLLVCAYAAVVVGFLTGLYPWHALITLVTLLLAVPAIRGASLYAENIPKLMPFMGMNVVINIATPFLLAVGLYFGK